MIPATLSDFRRIQYMLACRYVKAVDTLERLGPIESTLVRLRDQARATIAEHCAAWFEVQS